MLKDVEVSQPGDPWEREADRVAEQVMGSPVREPGGPLAGPGRQRSPAAEIVGEAGKPLPPAERAFFEPRFGQDFGGVRLHTGARASEAARSVGARAFTLGESIVFDSDGTRAGTREGRVLLAHELAHVVQQSGTGSVGAMPHHRPGAGVVQRYRSKDAANFGTCDDPPKWVEKPFADKDKDPWIETITVDFDGTTIDTNGDVVPTGKLSAMYAANSAKLPDVTGVPVVGGAASAGLTDRVSNKGVERVEGCGYHHTTVPKADRLPGHERGPKYFKPGSTGGASMSFALFFLQGKQTGNQAIHEGSLSSGSLACVHVGATDRMRQINYHSRVKYTKVTVNYGAAALQAACCARFNVKRVMVNNPCKGQDPKKCP